MGHSARWAAALLALAALAGVLPAGEGPGEGKLPPGLLENRGFLLPVARARLGAATTGRITAIYVETGDKVSADQLLVQIDDERRKLELEYARLDAENTAELEEARLNAVYRRQEFAVHQEMFARLGPTVESERQLETYRLNSEIAEVRLRVREAEQALREHLVKLREYDLASTRTLAPFAGVVTRKLAEVGQVAEIGTPLLELIDVHQLYFEINLPAARLREVALGDEVLVTPTPYPELGRRGRVVLIGPEVERTSNTVRIRVLLDNAEGLLRPGLTAEATFVSAGKRTGADREVERPAVAGAGAAP